MILKPLSPALELTLDLNIEDATLVSIVNTNTTVKFIRISPELPNSVIGIGAGERITLEKTAVQTLRGFDDAALVNASGSGVWATKVAYKG